MNKQNRNVIVVATTILVVVIATVVIVGLTLPEPEEIIQGEAETSDYRLSSKVAARVKEIYVSEGDRVSRGDTLVVLEAPEIDARLMQARAAEEAAVAMEQKANNGSRREQIQSAFEMWQKAKAGLQVAQKTFERVNRLFDNGVLAEQKRDEALAQYQAMEATEKAAKAQYDMALAGARHEDVRAAGAQTVRARGAVSEVASYVGETVLLASDDGVVTEIFPERGELVGSGAPLMNVAMTDDVWFTFNVREDLLPGLKVGKTVKVYLPAYDKEVSVRISRIKDIGSFATWKATKALDKYDLKTFEVRATPLSPLEGLRPGMTAVMRK